MKLALALSLLAVVSCNSPEIAPTPTALIPTPTEAPMVQFSPKNITGFYPINQEVLLIGYDTDLNGVPDFFEFRTYRLTEKWSYIGEVIQSGFDSDEDGKLDSMMTGW